MKKVIIIVGVSSHDNTLIDSLPAPSGITTPNGFSLR